MEYITIENEVINEIEIEKSRFICYLKSIIALLAGIN